MNRSIEEFLSGLTVIESALCDSISSTSKMRFGSPMQATIVWNNGVPFGAAGVPEKVNLRAQTEKATYTGDVDREIFEDCCMGLDRHEARSLVAAVTGLLLGT